MNQRTHIVIPEDLAEEIAKLVGKRGRSELLASAAWKEVRRFKVLAALKTASTGQVGGADGTGRRKAP